MPTISIITTTYKHQDFIAETIESVLAQTFTDWELLIGDDSPDNETQRIILEYVKKYPDKIKSWHHSPNKGIVDNMIFLLEKASIESEYIAFLEGDDMFTPDNLEKNIEIFNKNSEVGVITNGTLFTDEKSVIYDKKQLFNIEFFRKKGKHKYELKDMLLNIQTPIRSFGNVIIKKELITAFGKVDLGIYNNDKIFIPYDFIFWLNIFPKTIVYNSDNKTFIYRIHKNNNSSPINFEIGLNQLIYVYNLYFDDFPKEVEYLSILVKSKLLALKKEKLQSFKLLLKSLLIFPFKNIIYKISIILDILDIKNILIKILFTRTINKGKK